MQKAIAGALSSPFIQKLSGIKLKAAKVCPPGKMGVKCDRWSPLVKRPVPKVWLEASGAR